MLNLKFFRVFILFTVFNIAFQKASGSHLMGGEITYTYDGSDSFGSYYSVNLKIYRYCDNSGGPTAPLDPQMYLGIYMDDVSDPSGPKVLFATEILYLTSSEFIVPNVTNPNCSFTTTACIERGDYYVTFLLPDNPGGYHITVERCCRNDNIVNLNIPGDAGMSFYAYIPPGIVNSSPQISDISVPYVCTGDTVSLINNAYDPDGDSLAYAFVVPYNGYANTGYPNPDPVDLSPYEFPIPPVLYATGYNFNNMLGAGGYVSIDPVSGLTEYYFPGQGFYVVAIEIREYRNGVLLSSIRRDLQFISIACDPNLIPQFSSANGAVYTIPEGQTLCFDVEFTDDDGDSLYLEASGALIDPSVTNPTGIIQNASGDSTVSSQFCWTPVCGMSRPGPYQFSVTVTDNGCPAKTSSQVFSVYVTAAPGALSPSVNINQFPPGSLCDGSPATFTASPTLPGTDPTYQWSVNGVNAGTDSSVFYAGILNDGDVVEVLMVSNAQCLLTDSAVSPPFVVDVLAQPAAQVSITSNPSTNLCPQQICLYTAALSNGGSNPSYQWYINGTPGGTNFPSFTAASPSGILEVYVVVNPSTGCPQDTSNTIIFNILPDLTPDIFLQSTAGDSICPGQQVTFTVTSSNTGNAPVYHWTRNGANLAISNDTLMLNNLQNGDVINVSVTSTYPCLSPAYTYADPLEFHIYPPLSADLTDGPLTVCKGSSVSLEMMVTGGKYTTYQYDWDGNLSGKNTEWIIANDSGYYYAAASDECYSPVKDSIFINVLPVPVSDFTWTPGLPDSFFPDVRFTDLSEDAIEWEWAWFGKIFSDQQHPSYKFSIDGMNPVSLVTTNTFGCTDTIIKLVEFNEIITSYIPTSFTPNGDGLNDKFAPIGFATGGYSMKIFNRWGEELFESDGFGEWNGEDRNGNKAPVGTYVYLVKIKKDPTAKPYIGTLHLVR